MGYPLGADAVEYMRPPMGFGPFISAEARRMPVRGSGLGLVMVEWARQPAMQRVRFDPLRSLHGLGADTFDPCLGMSWWQRHMTPDCDLARLRAANPGSSSVFASSQEGGPTAISCEGLTATQCQALHIASTLPPGSSVDLESTTTTTPTSPVSRSNWFMYGAMAVGALMLYAMMSR